MNANLQFDFRVDKKNNTIQVKRDFAAGLNMVWDAWTKPELLDQWWAPKPYINKTKHMDFREGGYWLYSMTSPQNETHWCRADYNHVELYKSYSHLDAFCDENGTINANFPRTLWTSSFNSNQDVTNVNIVLKYNTLEDLEKIIAMGFKEGFGMALSNLDQYLEAAFKIRAGLKNNNRARVCSYLNFPGNTEEAFTFYKKVFRSEFSGRGIQRFGDIPVGEGQPEVADAVKKMVLHVELPVTANHVLMATDAPKEMGFTVTQGNNMHISLEPETREEAKRLFEELSAGGNVNMPLQDMFWGAYFGSFTDKFGINWMINHQPVTAD